MGREDRFPSGGEALSSSLLSWASVFGGKHLGDVNQSNYSHDKGHRDATGQRDDHVKPPQAPGEIHHAVAPLRTGEDGHVDNSCSSAVVLATSPLPRACIITACRDISTSPGGTTG